MDFNFSKQEKLLQGSVREYFRNKIVPVADELDRKAPLTRRDALGFIENLVSFGYVGSLVPEAENGPGLSHVETGIIFLELGKAWAALGAIAASTSHALTMISKSKRVPGIKYAMDRLMSSKSLGCVAVTEPFAGTDLSAIKTTAIPEGDTYIINGTKTWVSNGSVADMVLVTVKMESAGNGNPYGILLVEKEASFFDTTEIPKMGLKGLSTARLFFDDCRVPGENLLQFDENDSPAAELILPHTSCEKTALALGLTEAALEAAVSYARKRVQFGSPLARFQMIQKMIAEMAIGLDAGKLLYFRSMKMLDEGLKCPKELAMADSFASQTAVDATSKAIQIYGGYGYSDEYPVERFYRDAHCFSVMEGTKQIQQLKISQQITGIDALV